MDAAAQPQLTGLALQSLAQVTGSGSELAGLWDEVPSTWPASIAELLARLLDASPDSGKDRTADALLSGHFYQSAVRALTAIPDTALPGIYAISFYCWYQEEDPDKPVLTIGYNTEAQVQRTLTEQSDDGYFSLPAGTDEARWSYAFWLQNELAVLNDDTRDPIGTELTRTWIRASGLWYPEQERSPEGDAAADQIEDYFTGLYLRTARQLHTDGLIAQIFGRPIPILVHELEYYDHIANLTRQANPPGLADAFISWIDHA